MSEVKLSIPAVYNSFQVSPKDDEKNDANFPKTVGEAMVLFHRVGKPEFSEELQNNMEAMLQVLQQGPDGKSEVAFGMYDIICCFFVSSHPPICFLCFNISQVMVVSVLSVDMWAYQRTMKRLLKPKEIMLPHQQILLLCVKNVLPLVVLT
jgi:hypothetical protein